MRESVSEFCKIKGASTAKKVKKNDGSISLELYDKESRKKKEIPVAFHSFKTPVSDLVVANLYGRIVAYSRYIEQRQPEFKIRPNWKKDSINICLREAFGKDYLDEAKIYFYQLDFSKAAVCLQEGLNFVTCDCPNNRVDRIVKKTIQSLLEIHNKNVIYSKEYLFTIAWLFINEEAEERLYNGIDAINKYLHYQEDCYAYYIKGRLLSNLKYYEEALQSFTSASRFSPISGFIDYWIGMIKENFLGTYGLDYLFTSFVDNPSSICCAKEFARIFKQYSEKLRIPKGIKQNNLAELFNDYDISYFIDKLNTYINISWKLDVPWHKQKEASTSLYQFLEILESNRDLIEKKEFPNINIKDSNKTNSNLGWDRSENPWTNVLPGDEAETAYWNTE